MSGKIYGYCRVSTKKQNIERQERNILAAYPNAEIKKEAFTGKKIEGRKVFEQLLKKLNPGDTLVFDEVSRMSRNADEGYALYEELYEKGIILVFLKEPHINTETYRNALSSKIDLTGEKVDYILKGINEYLMALAKEQIRLAFSQAQKEVDYLSQRTKEGQQTARDNGKSIGRAFGKKIETKKSVEAKQIILKHSRDFYGTLNDADVQTLAKISRNTFYKYKRQLYEQMKSEIF